MKSTLRTRERLAWILLGLAAVLLAVWIFRLGRDGEGRAPLRAVATTGIIGDAVQAIGGDRVETTVLMGPGVDPHLYVASDEDLAALLAADVVFCNGLDLEAAMQVALRQAAERTRVVAVAEAVPEESLLVSSDDGSQFDPHVWFDLNLWQFAVERVRETLIDLDPQGEADYRANARTYLEQLHELDGYAIEQTHRIPEGRRVLISAHQAFNYFGRRYGFETRGVQGVSTADPTGANETLQLAEYAVARGVPALFSEPSIPVTGLQSLESAIRSRGAEVSDAGPLHAGGLGEAGTPDGSYQGMVRHNIDVIVAGLLEEDPQAEE